jgi:PKD repeat protein
MTTKRGWSVRGLLVACVLTLGLLVPGGVSALGNGDPCSPFWTEVNPPTAVLDAPATTVSRFDRVQFDASRSQQGTADKWTFVSADNACESTSTEADPIAFYTWIFGDGSPPEIDPVSMPVTQHAYAQPGTYVVGLTVTEQNCESGAAAQCFTDQAIDVITVQDRPPAARFTAPSSVTTGRMASFDASGSSDPDGLVTAYHWDFGDGQTQDTARPATSHTFATSGPKTVTLTVTDDSGSTGQLQHTVSVIDRPPSASFTAPSAIAKGQPARLDASASSDPDGTITSYRWDFGDGETLATSAPVVSHIYRTSGVRTVTLTITDGNGVSAASQETITVLARGCVVPRVVGRKVGSARRLLRTSGCRLGKVKTRPAGVRARRRVLRQSLPPGAVRPLGRAVAVTVGK